MGLFNFMVLGTKSSPNKKDEMKPHHFAKLLDIDSPAGDIAELYVSKETAAVLTPLRNKRITCEIFLDGKYTNVGVIKAA